LRGKDTIRTEYTAGQMIINSYVKELGFSSDLEVEFPPYRVDIYVMSLHAVVEYDGNHTFKSKDKRRDKFLMERYSLSVLRLTEFRPKEDVKSKLIFFFRDCAKKIEETK
jgi:very-short-patch-repair endonuclease